MQGNITTLTNALTETQNELDWVLGDQQKILESFKQKYSEKLNAQEEKFWDEISEKEELLKTQEGILKDL